MTEREREEKPGRGKALSRGRLTASYMQADHTPPSLSGREAPLQPGGGGGDGSVVWW